MIVRSVVLTPDAASPPAALRRSIRARSVSDRTQAGSKHISPEPSAAADLVADKKTRDDRAPGGAQLPVRGPKNTMANFSERRV